MNSKERRLQVTGWCPCLVPLPLPLETSGNGGCERRCREGEADELFSNASLAACVWVKKSRKKKGKTERSAPLCPLEVHKYLVFGCFKTYSHNISTTITLTPCGLNYYQRSSYSPPTLSIANFSSPGITAGRS